MNQTLTTLYKIQSAQETDSLTEIFGLALYVYYRHKRTLLLLYTLVFFLLMECFEELKCYTNFTRMLRALQRP